MRLTFRLDTIRLVDGKIEVDVTSDEFEPAPDPHPLPDPTPRHLPEGFDTDEAVGFSMLLTAMNEHQLTPIGVQGHGQQICDALNDTWPGLDTYAHRQSDAVMWPGFGSLDVTIDSGKGGWQFRPDRRSRYGEGR